MSRFRVAFVSVVPSPYQRDIFAALAARPDVDLSVYYMEAAAPDSPWPERSLAGYETILPGFWFPIGKARCHVNWGIPRLGDRQLVVLNTVMSLTAQELMRRSARKTPWAFWGERLRPRGSGFRQRLHDRLTAPLHQAHGIAAIGSLALSDYQKRFPSPRHFDIPYFCELRPFIDAPRIAPGRNTVFLMCGQMIARKGVDLLLGSFARLVETNPAVQLRLVGREAELPGLMATLPPFVRERVVYDGFQPPDELPKFFAQADVFVLPSRHDGWGVVVNQALGAGLPIICSDAVGAAHDLVKERVNGCLFPSGDAGALLKSMTLLASNAALRADWGAASRRMAPEWLPEAGASRWVAAFEQLIHRR